MQKKKPDEKKKAATTPVSSTCGFCGTDTGLYGTALCLVCSETKCVEVCIPGGKDTACTDCEAALDAEAEPDETDSDED